MGFGHVEVIWHDWAKIGPNMGVAEPRLGFTTSLKV